MAGGRGGAKSGQVQLGRVAFLPGPRRVTDLKVSLGSTTGTGNGSNDNPNAKFASYTPTTTPTETTPDDTTTTPTQTTPTQTAPTQTAAQSAPKKPARKKPTEDGSRNANANRKANPNGKATPTGNGNGSSNGTGNANSNAPSTEVPGPASPRRVVTAKVDVADQTLVAQ